MLYTASTAEHLRRFHAPYLAALVRDGHRVVAAGAGDGRGLPAGVEFRSLPFQKHLLSPENLRCLDTLVRWMERGRFDGVVANTALASFYTRLAAAVTRSGAWVVNISHGYLFAEPPGSLYDALLLGAERFLASITDTLLVMNETDRTIAARHRLCRGAVRRIDGMGVPMAVIAPSLPKERAALRAVLACDPRPRYQDDPGRVYAMRFAGCEVRFTADENTLRVTEIFPAQAGEERKEP